MVKVNRDVLGSLLSELIAANERRNTGRNGHTLVVFRLFEEQGEKAVPPGLESVAAFISNNGPFLDKNYNPIEGEIEVDDVALQSVISQIKSAYDDTFTPEIANRFTSQLYVGHTVPEVAWAAG